MGPDPNLKPLYTQLFIEDEWIPAVSGRTFEDRNPATGDLVADVAEGDVADIDRAVAAAERAFYSGDSPWRRQMTAVDRRRVLVRWATLIRRDSDWLQNLCTLERGTPYHGRQEAISGAEAIEYMAGWTDKITGDTLPSDVADGATLVYTRREPLGVAGIITAWNGPVGLFCWKVGTALAAGCTVVVKPAEDTPLAALHLAALAKEAGLPAGVLNVVPGYGSTAGAALAAHKKVAKISFTGSTAVGRQILIAAGQSNLKRVTLELGGKSPLVVCDDIRPEDLERIAAIAQMSCFANSGQVCVAPTRLFVQSGIYEEFVAVSRRMAAARLVGDPYDPTSDQGSQINRKQYERILELIRSGIQEGARLEAGGGPLDPNQKGFFVRPTVFSNVQDHMRIAREEIFGPVQQILKFDTVEEVTRRANETTYGLAAGIFTTRTDRALAFAHGVEAGIVWVNDYMRIPPAAPFGGYKMSGMGRENGRQGLEEYLETKTVRIRY